ncbi:hypothetical protein [Saccharothrix stipae]
MSPPSLIGGLDSDNDTYTVRPCNRLGFPANQVAELGKALHRYHDGDLDRLLAAILRHDWESINPWSAGHALDTGQRTPGTAENIRPYRGIGYHLTESAPEPSTGRLRDRPAPSYRWLYAFDAEVLRVFHNQDDRRWVPMYDFVTAELATLDLAGLGDLGTGLG